MRSERNSGNHRISQLPRVPLLLARGHKVSRPAVQRSYQNEQCAARSSRSEAYQKLPKAKTAASWSPPPGAEANLKNGNRSSPNRGARLAIQPLNYLNIRLLTHKR
jgi:hypothetical protein